MLPSDVKHAWALVTYNGGQFETKFSRRVTHLITTECSGVCCCRPPSQLMLEVFCDLLRRDVSLCSNGHVHAHVLYLYMHRTTRAKIPDLSYIMYERIRRSLVSEVFTNDRYSNQRTIRSTRVSLVFRRNSRSRRATPTRCTWCRLIGCTTASACARASTSCSIIRGYCSARSQQTTVTSR